MDPATIEYWFGTGSGQPTRWYAAADVDASGDGIADAISLDFDGDGRRDDLLWDSDGDGRADRSLLDLDDDGHAESSYADPHGRGTWSQPVADAPAGPSKASAGGHSAGPRGSATPPSAVGPSQMNYTTIDGRPGRVGIRDGPDGFRARADIDGDGRADDLLIDRDRDGRADLAVVTDPAGRPERLYLDADRDGRWDTVLLDTDHDGRADQTRRRGDRGFAP